MLYNRHLTNSGASPRNKNSCSAVRLISHKVKIIMEVLVYYETDLTFLKQSRLLNTNGIPKYCIIRVFVKCNNA